MRTVFFLIITFFSTILYSQDEAEWETEIYNTGYISINSEYISNLSSFSNIKNNFGIDISEASILTTLHTLPRLKVFSVFTYKPRLNFNSMIAELSGEYTFSQEFSIKTGRFLLPINPINANYYALANLGIALPSFITNHKLFPFNITGIDVNGKIDISGNSKISYNLIAGQYVREAQTESGILGFFGREGIYLSDDMALVQNRMNQADSINNLPSSEFIGYAARLAMDVNSDFQIGTGLFYSKEEKKSITQIGKEKVDAKDVISIGLDSEYKLDNFFFQSSIWFGKEIPEDNSVTKKKDYYIFMGSIAYTFYESLTPYLKLEIIKGMSKEDRNRLITGVNFRPNYEFTLKIEYIRYLQTQIQDFNIFQGSLIYSF